MKAPSRIYVPEKELRDRCWSEHKCSDVEYVHKDALLEWARERKKDVSEQQQKHPQDNDWYDGESFILEELIDKINSL